MVDFVVNVLLWTLAIASGLVAGTYFALLKAEGRGPWRGARR